MKTCKTDFRFSRVLALLLLSVLLFCSVGCDYIYSLGDVVTSAEAPSDETLENAETTLSPLPVETVPVETAPPADSETLPTEVVTTAPESTASGEISTYIDPLTGLLETKDLSEVRPISLVFDNVSIAAPQSGISNMDILIEMMVEGGISRLVGITNDYLVDGRQGTLDVYGPIRSTRPYLISFSQAFGSLMVGAGGSPQGYDTISKLGLNYIDGVNDRYALQGFYRDVERYISDGYEHSLMITGKGITDLAETNSYSIFGTVKPAFNFIEEGKQMYLSGGAATHVILKYSLYQQVQLVYSSQTGNYYRYQHGDEPHLDAENGEQLNFRNVIILFAQTSNIVGDTEGRLDIQTTGSGDGYYISDGRYVPIRWSRANETAELVITGMGGEKLTINRGKTFISVVNSSLKGTSSVELNFKVSN